MKPSVFISHSHKDQASYSALCLALESSGISRWDVSKLTLGRSLSDGLREAINECEVCVFLATKRSIKSSWCLAELGAFWGAKKKVIIYQAEPDIAKSEIPPQFQGDLWTSDAKKLLNALDIPDSESVKRTPSGFVANLGTTRVQVCFGKIEELDCSDNYCLVALPSNEYFDDECIHDKRSSLGAFMQHHFKESIQDIQDLVKENLKDEPHETVYKKPTETGASYGVGKCVFLNSPMSLNLRVAMVAVTTQRANEGLKADASYIFSAASSLLQLMANNRLTCLHVPILGSGHGGLRQEVSLMCMLIAFGELSRKTWHNLKEVNIVVHRRDNNSKPSVSEIDVEEYLRFAEKHLK